MTGPKHKIQQPQLGQSLIEPLPHENDPLERAADGVVAGRWRVAAVDVHQAALQVAVQERLDGLLVTAEMHPAETLLYGQVQPRGSEHRKGDNHGGERYRY